MLCFSSPTPMQAYPRCPVLRRAFLTLHSTRVLRYCASASLHPSPAGSNLRPRSLTRCRETMKRKVALIVGYDGSLYHGIQRNRDVVTLSDVFEKALHSAGAISDDNLGHLEKIKWQVAARTDRGVSAAGNVISLKLLFNKKEMAEGVALSRTTERVNELLPDHVQLFGVKQITGGFAARTACGQRWYEYMLPVAALGDISSLDRFRGTLKKFEGTHKFHNYTVGTDHCVPPRSQASRYILEAVVDAYPITLHGDSSGEKYVRIRVKGQSFMLHQIRKMVSLALLIHTGRVCEDAIERSFCDGTLINIPPAPAVGLFLDCCHFDGYNVRHEKFLTEPLSVKEFDTEREAFKLRHILPSIVLREKQEDALDVFFRTADAHPVKFR